jgi:carbon-monoxide dehydrogenase small subunit
MPKRSRAAKKGGKARKVAIARKSRSVRKPRSARQPARPAARAAEPSGHAISVTVNGRLQERRVEPRVLLVDFLRDDLRLTGTHVGCDTSHCGACTVLLDGRAVKSCTMFAVQADGSEVLTVEGLASGGKMHPVQEAFKANHGLQCGFCTPGVVLAAVAFLRENKAPSEDDIRVAISGNLCRCTGYQNIVKSVAAAAAMAAADGGA